MSALLDRIYKNGADSEFISDDDLSAVIARAAELEKLDESTAALDAAAIAYFRSTFDSDPDDTWVKGSRTAFKAALICAIATTKAE